MSSDSELSVAVPDDDALGTALKDAVNTAFANGKQGELSINSIRSAVEKELDLDGGFFKSHDKWKSLSKSIIGEAVAAAEQAPPKAAKKGSKGDAQKKPSGAKRKSDSTKEPKRRRKANGKAGAVADDSSVGEESEAGQTSRKANGGNASDSSRLSEAPSDLVEGGEQSAEVEQGQDSESEMSDVKDEAPPKKRRRSAGPKSDTKTAAPAKTKASKSAKDMDLSPDEQEIKKLQSWLLKCGIRKLWHRELASCDSNKAKIKHLKGMLEDVGMTGRYSVEKANSIKEQRELAADLEAVQEGNKHWGADSASEKGDDSDSAARPARRNRNTSRFVDFGDDEDDE